MFTWIENEIITINPGKESKKIREGKFSKKTGFKKIGRPTSAVGQG